MLPTRAKVLSFFVPISDPRADLIQRNVDNSKTFVNGPQFGAHPPNRFYISFRTGRDVPNKREKKKGVKGGKKKK